MVSFEKWISRDFFDVFPKITLANYENVFSIYIGFLFFHGEIAYLKKAWRQEEKE